jgi:hypothetical protein
MDRKNLATGFCFALLMAGCAVTPERAATMSNYELCEMYYGPFSSNATRSAVEAEALSRSIDCRPMRAEIERAYDQAIGNLSRSMEKAGTEMSPPQPVTCRTYRLHDGSYSTYCR